MDFPLRHHVQIKHASGRSDLEPLSPKVSEEVKEESTKFDVHVVKKSKSRDFPVSEHYQGPLDETNKHREMEPIPLEQQLHSYPPQIPSYPPTPKLKRGVSEERDGGGEVKQGGFR